MSAEAGAGPARRRFGLWVGGVPLLLPQSPLEHIASATVHPLPGAGPRVVGLAQLRGHPVVVLDPCDTVATRAADHPPALLVIGVPPEAGALLVDAPPRAIRIGAACPEAVRPEAVFAAALDAAFLDADDPACHWWQFETRRLLALLAGAA